LFVPETKALSLEELDQGNFLFDETNPKSFLSQHASTRNISSDKFLISFKDIFSDKTW
jgi:hypothetical protein